MTDPAYTVAYQGTAGAFSELAARTWTCDGPLLPCPSLLDVCDAVAAGRADAAVIPVENSIAGPVPGARELLTWFQLTTTDECVLPIRQALIGLPGAALADVRDVCSHPVALAQCTRFFARHHAIRPRAWFDTAGAVRDVVRFDDTRVAAIASAHAADVYGARVLAHDVHDCADNATRFVLVRRRSVSAA